MMRKISMCRCLLLKCIREPLHRNINTVRCIYTNNIHNAKLHSENDSTDDWEEEVVPAEIKVIRDNRIVYSSYMARKRINLSYKTRRYIEGKYQEQMHHLRKGQAIPLVVENVLMNSDTLDLEREILEERKKESRLSLPYAEVEDVNVTETISEPEREEFDWHSSKTSLQEEIARRMEAYQEGLITAKKSQDSDLSNTPVEKFPLSGAFGDPLKDDDEDVMEYGTCDPNVPVSRVPCGGCGAVLHCQDFALPGFIPKEVFEGLNQGQLRSEICQRCYFLKHHNVALNVRVSPDVYQKLLEPIKDKTALVVVVVDLLDVPCSIWPNLIDIVGTRRPVVIVGNKVDLLPADGKNHLQKIRDALTATIDNTPLGRANIKHIALVSAYTGFGIEKLITKIQNSWGVQGEIFIVGCTNSGKSTLFNALLGSDMCKNDASDLVRRATTSPWPGTTLNMLKFPVMRPSGNRLYLRTQRLRELDEKKKSLDKTNEYTFDAKLATLTGFIGRTFAQEGEPEEKADPFSTNVNKLRSGTQKIIGINEKDPKYASGKWCYDTPGTVQPDQMINLLTHEELMRVLPRELIVPRTYSVTSGKSLFIGGLARLDILYCPESVRLTVFASPDVHVSIVRAVEASSFYRDYLGTSLLGVPMGGEERLQHWPALLPCDLRMMSDHSQESCGDVVLSSAGWVTLTTKANRIIEVRGWTPGGRGVYLRSPSMFPRIASLKGRRLSKSPAYRPHKLLIPRPGAGDETA